ncbi:MAG: PEP-CTERM sorting domain-containing protein [Phycisphaerales bacterium]
MRITQVLTSIVALGLFALGFAASAHAGTIVTEGFDGYGNAVVDPFGGPAYNGGSNWAAAWTNVGGNPIPRYIPGTQLNYTATGWTDVNGNTSTDGLLRTDSSNNDYVSNAARRDYAGTDQSGVLWLAFLFKSTNTGNVLNRLNVYFRDTSLSGVNYENPGVTVAGTGLHLSTGVPITSSFNDSFHASASNVVAANVTNLVLVKFDTDYSGTNDRITLWLNPTNVTSEAQLDSTSAAKLTRDPGTDLYGTALAKTLGVGGRSDFLFLDQLRIAYGGTSAEGLLLVTSTVIPEPATLGLMAIGGLMMLPRRR